MKTNLVNIIGGWMIMLLSLTTTYAQAPNSIAGDSLLMNAIDGVYPFPSTAIDLLIPANSGSKYQFINIFNAFDSTGTYSYSKTSSLTAAMNLIDPVDGEDDVSLNFSSLNGGYFTVTNNSAPGAYITGNFNFFSVSARSSITGKTIIFNVSDGAAPFASSGSLTIYTAASGNTYKTDNPGQSGTYSYSLVNKSTGKLRINDSYTGSSTIYIGFKDALNGSFALTQPSSGGFQIGSFVAIDTVPPTVAFTSPTTGQRWSNSVFTAAGKADDDVQVAHVYYQILGEDWNLATTTNGWTNWSGIITLLTPGTNVIQAYSVDTSGNISPTNKANIDFVVTNQLQMSATGLGIITPNYSNAWLEIGRNYSIKATPATGFVFTNWIISTNLLGGVTTNNATVQFTMASNLTLQANFVDVTKPTLTITAPKAGQHLTNALANVKGTASDNWKVSGVWYQLNGGEWTLPNTTNGWTNWEVTLPLLLGTNTLKSFAMDLGGNLSLTKSVSFVSSNDFKLQLIFLVPQPLASNGLNFSVERSPGINGHVEVSTNLVDWLTLTNFAGTNLTINFRDAAATNFNQRFYRAVTP
jgi:hypothetical protein